MGSKIRYFDLKVDIEDAEAGVKDLLQLMYPSWNTQNTTLKFIQGGFLNQMIQCMPGEEVRDWVVVRIFGEEVSLNRDSEVMGLQIAHAARCGTPLLALFVNGFVIGYSSGSTLQYQDYRDHKVMRDVFQALGRFHGIDLDSLSLVDVKGNISQFDKTNKLRKAMENFIRQIPDKFKLTSNQDEFERCFKSKDNLKDESEFLLKSLRRLNLPVTLCHLDFHSRNIMYNHKSGEVTLVDHEFCGFCYEAVDCTVPLFCRTAHIFAGIWPENSQPISESDKELWSLWYLEGKASVQGRDPASISQYEVNKFTTEVNIMGITNIFQRALLILSIADSEKVASHGVDIMEVAKYSFDKYQRNKEMLEEYMRLYREKY